MKSKNISISLIRLYGGFLLLLLVITFTGCIFFAGSDTGIAVPNLTIKGAPSDITALSLRVTGPGMSPVESYYSSVPSSITVEVPAGNDREFELIAYIGPSNPSAATSFKGTATADLAAGETQNITLNMITNETKLVIPDYNNNRVVQIDDKSGGGWKEIINTDIGYGPNLAPYDIDFDSQGRIYIAIYTFSLVDPFIIRIDDFDAVTYTTIIMGKGNGCVALAADRNNGYLYYAMSNALYRCNLDGTGDTTLTITVGVNQIQTIRGMAVGEDGMLYIAGNNTAGLDRIFRYDPTNQVVTTVYDNTIILSDPWDVLIKPPYLYVANLEGADGYKILQLDLNLQLVGNFGVYSTLNPEISGNFYGPRRFVAIMNRKITIIDDDDMDNYDKLVSMDDIDGTNWDYYGSSGFGTGQFNFYYVC